MRECCEVDGECKCSIVPVRRLTLSLLVIPRIWLKSDYSSPDFVGFEVDFNDCYGFLRQKSDVVG